MVKARTVFGHCEQLEQGLQSGLPTREISVLIAHLEDSLQALGDTLVQQRRQA
ncbi:hypothetical protein D3C84_1284050 [compost metagenome]